VKLSKLLRPIRNHSLNRASFVLDGPSEAELLNCFVFT
jgi:hypothetical protein